MPKKPFAANGRKLRTLSADIEILNGMWDNVRVGNEPGSTFGCGEVYRLACYISAASKRGSRAKARDPQSAKRLRVAWRRKQRSLSMYCKERRNSDVREGNRTLWKTGG